MADLQGQDILTYDVVRREQFDEELARYLRSAVERSDSSGLVDANSYEGIIAVPVMVKPTQSALAIAFPIIRFTTEILRVFSQENRQLDLIDRHTQILSQLSIDTERERLRQALQEIKRDWMEFVALEEASVSKRIRKLIKEEGEIKKAIKGLNNLPIDSECTELLDELNEDILNIISHMNKYDSNLNQLKQQMSKILEELLMLEKKDYIAKELNLGCSKLIEEVYSLTGLAGNAIPQTYQILDKLGGGRV
jgi:exonuclease VII large subunit